MNEDIRHRIHSLLGVNCVFPDYVLGSNSPPSAARAMLENRDSFERVLNYDDTTEDIIVRWRGYLMEVGENTFTKSDEVLKAIKYMTSKVSDHVETVYATDTNNSALHMKLDIKQSSSSRHPGIANILKLVIGNDDVLLVQSYAKHSLLSIARFHANTTLSSATLSNVAGLGSKDIRIRFIIFQLLQAVTFLHENKLCMDTFKPNNVMLDDDMWLYLTVGLSDRLFYKSKSTKIPSESTNGDVNKLQLEKSLQHTSMVDRPLDYYLPLTIQWVTGKVSNFEYLMAINYGAGRTMMDPLYHPIIPWVTDFNTQITHTMHSPLFEDIRNGSLNESSLEFDPTNISYKMKGFRDLTKTKFRLSKGDAQLDTTYRHSDPPHHIPESLSELTYYIYLARRTPMQVLRRVVRDVFVPEHYPHSIARIYDWTPDECVPEFYFDSSVFQSIHKDVGMIDLELPAFASTPEEFIKFHRSILESDFVSSQLHRWIDLTFGFCLEGEAAIENMNVPLKHTLSTTERIAGDSPSLNKHPGFVMLFDKPHPQKQIQRDRYRDHIFSHNQAFKELTSGELNEEDPSHKYLDLYSLNNSSKYSTSLMTNFNVVSPPDAFDINALVELDYTSGVMSLYNRIGNIAPKFIENITQQPATQMQTILKEITSSSKPRESSSLITTTTTSDIELPFSTNQRASGRNMIKKSLIRVPGDPTHSILKYAGDIKLGSDSRCRMTLKMQQNQTKEYQFSELFGTSLEATYSLHEGESMQTHKPRLPAPVEKDSRRDIQFWDGDFAIDVEDVCEVIEKNPLNEDDETEKALNLLQSEDMFAIGCMISELYTGRPLLNRFTAASIQSTEDVRETIRFVYRNTTELPLTLRRLVSILIQNNAQARPTAMEVLQACLGNDESMWLPLDLSLQRSGGSEPGYVVFHPTDKSNDKTAQTYKKMSDIMRSPQNAARKASGLSSFQTVKNDPLTQMSKVHKRLLLFIDSEEQAREVNLKANARVELLSDYCSGLFPPYFKIVFRIVGELKLCPDGLDRFWILLKHLDQIAQLPLDGLGLSIAHILDIIGNPTPFRPIGKTGSSHMDLKRSASEINDENYQQMSMEEQIIMEYPTIVDVLGARLGLDGTEKLVVPRVIDFLNHLLSPSLLICLLKSPLWSVVLFRAGVKCFLRYFLPLLLTYVSAGSLHLVAKGDEKEKTKFDFISPLWATLDSTNSSDSTEWLHSCPLINIKEVQKAAVGTISNLIEPEAMGPGLVTRYVLPSLMSLIGLPQLALAGFETMELSTEYGMEIERLFDLYLQVSHKSSPQKIIETVGNVGSDTGQTEGTTTATHVEVTVPTLSVPHAEILHGTTDTTTTVEAVDVVLVDDAIKSDLKSLFGYDERAKLDSFAHQKASYNPQDMYAVQSVLNLSMHLSEIVISDLILSKLFNATLVDIEVNFQPQVKPSTVAALMEVILLLKGLLPSIAPEVVQKDYLQPAKLSGICLPRLLLTLPFKPCWHLEDHTFEDLQSLVNSRRLYNLHLELCKLLVSCCMIAGAEACTEYVLPSVDRFFRQFVETFGMVPIESRTMLKAFELGAELFLPLAQLTGAEAFYTAVPNLNPRLEMWLVSVGSSIPATSPPLPSNIWPEVATEATKEAEKKKGFMHWISSKSKWISSTSTTLSSQPVGLSVSSISSSTPTTSTAPGSNLLFGGGPGGFPLTASPALYSNIKPTSDLPGPSIRTPTAANFQSTNNPTGTSYNSYQAKSTSVKSTDDMVTPARPSKQSSELSEGPQTSSKQLSQLTMSESRETSPIEKREQEPPPPPPMSSPDFPPTLKSHSNEMTLTGMELRFIPSNGEKDTKREHLRSNSTTNLIIETKRSASVTDIVPMERQRASTLSTKTNPIEKNHKLIPVAKLLDSSEKSTMKLEKAHRSDGNSVELDSDDEEDTDEFSPDRWMVSREDATHHHSLMEQMVKTVLNSNNLPTTDIEDEAAGPGLTQNNQYDYEEESLVATSSENGSYKHSSEGNTRAASRLKTNRKPSVESRDDNKIEDKQQEQLPGHSPLQSKTLARKWGQDDLTEQKRSARQPFKQYRNMVGSKTVGSSAYGTNRRGSTASSGLKKTLKASSLMSGLPSSDNAETFDHIENKDQYHIDSTWLLAGNGRWSVDKEIRDKAAKEQIRLVRGNVKGSNIGSTILDWNPPAQISLTAPRIALDVAGDAVSMFNLNMHCNTHFRIEDSPGLIRCMVVNPIESLLMTCSKTGVRLWNLNSHPLQYLASYNNHSTAPFSAGFMRDGLHATTCDGNIHVWDVESRKSLGFISGTSDRGSFLSMAIIPPRNGIVPGIGTYGDDQLITTAGSTIGFYDFRSNCSKALQRLTEWHIPQIPPPPGHFVTSAVEPLQLTCATCHDNYIYAGSLSGGLWVIDRRMGKVLLSWQGHDGSILKIHAMSDRHFLSVADRSASVWEYQPTDNTTSGNNFIKPDNEHIRELSNSVIGITQGHGNLFRDGGNSSNYISGSNAQSNANNSWMNSNGLHMGFGSTGEIKRVLNVKNMPDNGLLVPSTLIVHSYDQLATGSHGLSAGLSNIRGGSPDKAIVLQSKPKYMLYCMAGHKMYSGRLPTYDSSSYNRENMSIIQPPKEGVDWEEIKLNQTYFHDRKGSKLSKSKLMITSSVLLPLRRILLLGTDDGLIRIIS